MIMIKGYEHQIAFHCESGSVRNLLNFNNFKISEPMVFGLGTGLVFAYLINTKAISGFPVMAIRLPMGAIVKNIKKLLGINFFYKKFKYSKDALNYLKSLIDDNIPSAICVDMFYMKYLPSFMQIHVPFHFVIPIGYDEDKFYISDAYYQGIGELNVEYLKAGWETHAKFAMNNFLTYINSMPDPKNIDWKKAIKKSILKSCTNMNIPFPVNVILPIFGVNGIRFFASQFKTWTKKHRGLPLREGILGTATIFEEQGTGGGAFRFLYASFLQESAEIFNSNDLKEISKEMTLIAQSWREGSRKLIKIGRQLPIKNDEYDDWFSKNKKWLDDSLSEADNIYFNIADSESKLFNKLNKIIKTLK
ncbi:MAG: DUF4872 domain-containing protein [Spirochaetes bacterium]|nr:DUF4872 domain-containing protein [Spirochaetota bacterium]